MDVPGPYLMVVSLLVIGVLGLVLKWAFATDQKRDYGVLREIARVPSQRAADVVVARLRYEGIRVTTVRSMDGESLRIMVFPVDEHRAVAILLEETSD
ncbi:hypothetical protein ACFPM7_04480 [Actinokineospora guangxiensis]|uniref:Uncharacterized protein n=1 Tax=Actinokineospora guangxiensis TaxID=1490288 RepID=A0ABW0EH59_9PSEU